MKYTKTLHLLALILFINIPNLIAQSQRNGMNNIERVDFLQGASTSNNNDAEGSRYLNENFTKGKISTYPNQIFDMRYNAFSDEMEVKLEESKVQYYNKTLSDVLVTFSIDNLNFTLLNYINSDDYLLKGYFVSLTDNSKKIKLYAKKSITFHKGKRAETHFHKDRPAQFKSVNDEYYITIDDSNALELPSKKKDIAKLFPENSKEVLNFIKTNRIKTSREADVIQLINYINSL